jgi:8-oxo-dGTP pyrophosphatase MutT (NUDIX family)
MKQDIKSTDPKEPRHQYAALPYRRNGTVEILLVSSRGTRRWVLPKGWPMKGRQPHAAAKQEALEEAGVVGKIAKESVGDYQYLKRLKNGAAVLCTVTVFPMRVERQRKNWLEKDQRTTRWFSLPEAAEAVQEPELRDVIRNFEKWSAEGDPAGFAENHTTLVN